MPKEEATNIFADGHAESCNRNLIGQERYEAEKFISALFDWLRGSDRYIIYKFSLDKIFVDQSKSSVYRLFVADVLRVRLRIAAHGRLCDRPRICVGICSSWRPDDGAFVRSYSR